VPAALGATRLLKSLLFGLEPSDPLTIVCACASLFAAGGLAALETSLTPASLNDWTGRLRRQEVEVFLPKFK